ncbi:MAG: hypothetical protein PVF50_10550 [Gammaproteobacteria bacterium]
MRVSQAVLRAVSALFTFAVADSVSAQADLSGMWAQRFHEELPERGEGPEIGDYTGLPVNDAARLRADSWDASKWTVPERQCEPHPPDYAPRGPANLRIASSVDPVSQEVVSWDVTVNWSLQLRTIYMDGRAHPSANAQHTWQGFSTGEWDGDMLKVTTTHLKEGWVRRNGLPRSDKATLTEYFIRNQDYLTLVTIVDDPVYLTEPLIRTSDWVLDPGMRIGPFSCIPVVEIERPRGAIIHNLPGTNPFLTEFAERHGIPFEVSRGGAATMYPEYLRVLRSSDGQ